METEQQPTDFGQAMAIQKPEYVQVEDFTTFHAEYGISHKGHFVMHFFASPEVKALPDLEARLYWLERMPSVLDEVAGKHMRYLGLKIYYIEDLVSYCVEAEDSAEIPGTVAQFFEDLDQALETLKST